MEPTGTVEDTHYLKYYLNLNSLGGNYANISFCLMVRSHCPTPTPTPIQTPTQTRIDSIGFNSNLCLCRCLCSVNTSTQFYTTHFFIGVCVGIGVGQCERTINVPTFNKEHLFLRLQNSL